MKKCYIAIAFFLILGLPGKSQNVEWVVNNNVKNVEVRDVLNFNKEKFKLSDLNGKMVILDFGNLGCPPCIKSLLKYDSLQQIYQDKLVVIWVTPDSVNKIRDFLKNNAVGRSIHLPIVANDKALAQSFKHIGTPYLVWIDQYSNVLSFTSARFASAETIVSSLETFNLKALRTTSP